MYAATSRLPFTAMSTKFGASKSSMDVSASEFVPCDEFLKKLTIQNSINQTKELIEPIFNDGKNFLPQLDKLKKLACVGNVNAPRLIGELICDLSTMSSNRTGMGFRLFKELRASLPVRNGLELEGGTCAALRVLVENLLSDSAFKLLCSTSVSNSIADSHPPDCVEAGDTPSKPNSQSIERAFGLLAFMNLLITRLNSSDQIEEYLCIPPAQPCVVLCTFVEGICRVQNQYVRNEHATVIEEHDLFGKDWLSLVYQSFDTFSNCLVFLNYSLTCSGQRNGLSDSKVVNAEEYGLQTQLTSLLNNILQCSRELLLDEKLPVKLIRSTVLDILINANSNYPEPYKEPQNVDESENDEVYDSFEQFLQETRQLNSS